jgi:hypothetical protein
MLNYKFASLFLVSRIIYNSAVYRLELPANIIAKGIFLVFYLNLLCKALQDSLLDQAPIMPKPINVIDKNRDNSTK